MTTESCKDRFASLFKKLLPQGLAWDQVRLQNLWRALAVECCRIEQRAAEFLRNELHPLSADETFEDWKETWGIPNECTPSNATDDDLRNQILHLMKMHGAGALSAQFYEDLAAAFGVDVTVTNPVRFLSGRGRSGDRITGHVGPGFKFRSGVNRSGDKLGQHGWAFVFQVDVPVGELTWFRSGQSRSGDRIREATNPLMQCTMNKFKPAHTSIYFTFGG